MNAETTTEKLEKFEKIDIHPQWEVDDEEEFKIGHSMSFKVLLYPEPPVVAPPVKAAPGAKPAGAATTTTR